MNLSASSICREIISVVDRVYASTRSEAELRLSSLRIIGDVKRFLISRMGSTGSTWFAKLLDGHPDVHCTHEGYFAQIYPADQFNPRDLLRFIEYFAWDAKHHAYQALGDVGSVLPYHLACLPSFTTALLVRHPARILNTRLAIYPANQSFSNIPAESRTSIREIWGIDLNHYEPIDQIFLHDTFIFASQVWAFAKIDFVIRIEDTRELENCGRILKSLTGLDYRPELIEQASQRRVNQRTHGAKSISEIVAGFSPRQRDWYKVMLADIVPYFGYGLLHDLETGMAPADEPGRNVQNEYKPLVRATA